MRTSFLYELKNKMTASSQQIPVHQEVNISVCGCPDLEDFLKTQQEFSGCTVTYMWNLHTGPNRKSILYGHEHRWWTLKYTL